MTCISHLSTRNYFLMGLAGFEPGQEGGGHLGGLSIGKPSRTGRTPSPGLCSSFEPGTTVLMADGSHKPIEEIKVGDKVLATDPATGETQAQPVLGTTASKGDKKLVQITVDDDTSLLTWTTGEGTKYDSAKASAAKRVKGGVVIATDSHPFWVAGDINAWVEAADLKPGMWLRTSAGTYVQVSATRHWTTHHQRAHNLTVANAHTYYVAAGAATLLTHNCGVELYKRVRELALQRADAGSTTAIARVRNRSTGNLDTWVSTEVPGIPDEWRGNMPSGTERLVLGNGRHAEMNIMNALGNDWELVGMASSTRMCPRCLARAQSLGLSTTGIGRGEGVSSTGNTPYRVVLRK